MEQIGDQCFCKRLPHNPPGVPVTRRIGARYDKNEISFHARLDDQEIPEVQPPPHRRAVGGTSVEEKPPGAKKKGMLPHSASYLQGVTRLISFFIAAARSRSSIRVLKPSARFWINSRPPRCLVMKSES